ncbi:hypothetical protein KC963_01040 [Candidatus Saccharibacteria bacterium]|nr:hypothetical protein [Candidatus Saccharibacteria bacterium]MCA9337518.1 hypothetical protein [Candidatus Saccharibacteria bacterium]
MAEQRLPVVDGDDGAWGEILNQFIEKEHYNTGTDNAANGGHKTITIRPGTATAGTAPLKFSSGTLLSSPEAGAMEFNSDTLYFTITTGSVRKTVATYDDSSGATGDMYYRNSGGVLTRLPIGSSNNMLKVSGGLPTWGDVTFNTATKTSNYTVTTSDTVLLADAASGNITITLPAASSSSGYRFFIKRIDNSGNTVTVQRAGSDTIDGATSQTLDLQYTSITVVSNGSNWYII